MPKQSFAFESGGEKRLGISWEGTYRNVNVSLDGNPIGIITDKKALSVGQEFHLADGSTMKVQLVDNIVSTELQVLRNGQPLPGSASDPQTRLKNAYQAIYLAGGACIISSIWSVLFNSEHLLVLSNGFTFSVFGLVLIPLGLFVRRKSVVALLLAIVLWIGFGILGFYLLLQGYHSVVGVLIYIYCFLVFFLVPMFQGFGAIEALKIKHQ